MHYTNTPQSLPAKTFREKNTGDWKKNKNTILSLIAKIFSFQFDAAEVGRAQQGASGSVPTALPLAPSKHRPRKPPPLHPFVGTGLRSLPHNSIVSGSLRLALCETAPMCLKGSMTSLCSSPGATRHLPAGVSSVTARPISSRRAWPREPPPGPGPASSWAPPLPGLGKLFRPCEALNLGCCRYPPPGTCLLCCRRESTERAGRPADSAAERVPSAQAHAHISTPAARSSPMPSNLSYRGWRKN